MAGPKILSVFLKGNEMLPVPKAGSGLMTVVFDLDNTLAEGTWPSPWIGKPIDKAIKALLRYHDQGYEIVLWTSRPASHLDEIKRWLRNNGLADIVYDVRTDKIRAALYVDDRAAVWPESFDAEPVTEGDKRRALFAGSKCSFPSCGCFSYARCQQP